MFFKRWCVSCLWSTATAMLYRLLANPLPQITAPKQSKPRPAGKEHLHPEPKVECVVLHQPATPKVDVIFVHGLYGSLGNTWRQGEWRSKYKIEPNKISLRRPSSIPSCDCSKQTDRNTDNDNIYNDEDFKDNNKIESIKNSIKEENENILNFTDKEITFTNIDEYYKRRITDDEIFITEKFYKEVDQIEVIDNYDTQAKFVRDLFNMENLKAVKKDNDNCRCRAEEKRCEVGCGCICDECYSACWPRDWIKEDYPHARVISINYTSDPHLWRPLWIKQCKRLHLHERADQMIAQLVALGVGERPIVWVGHSKGGLFIKQIYCDAYEAYIKLNGNNTEEMNDNVEIKQNCDEYDKDNEMNKMIDSNDNKNISIKSELELYAGNEDIYEQVYDGNIEIDDKDVCITDYSNEVIDNRKNKLDDRNINYDDDSVGDSNCDIRVMDGDSSKSSNKEEDIARRALLWTHSSGFMFYSVPHRGSPLADIKTPFTARSVELLEMGQDCSLVTRLHARWLAAAAAAPPRVRSLVETARTLMAVLWLRIVSADSADAGIGALCGVSVDHREICKPSSRHCILYTELKALIHAALNKCQQ